jgi:hypothetical protein
MIKKVFWTVGTVIVLFVAAYLLLMRFAPTVIPANIPVVGKLTCLFPVNIAGSSMSPALPAGSKVVFDRCPEDRLNLSSGTIIAFKEGKIVRIARIIEKNTGASEVIYKTSQDGKPEVFIHVSASQIIATYDK